MTLNHGSLFSGIGGFDLAAEWMGWNNVFHCEINPFCQIILKHHFPNAHTHTDIKATDFNPYRGKVDILTGGFPCQPFSQAGKRKGTADDRYLWPEMLRAIREIQPTYIVGENVYGLISWDGGVVFRQVLADLGAEGYEVAPVVLPACGVNAPHRRYRIWFVAYAKSWGRRELRNSEQEERPQSSAISQPVGSGGILQTIADTASSRWFGRGRGEELNINEDNATVWADIFSEIERLCSIGVTADTDGFGLRGESDGAGIATIVGKDCPGNYWSNFPTQSPVCSGDDGLSARLDDDTFHQFIPNFRIPKGITFKDILGKEPGNISFPRWRSESIKGYGNAIVPQVALQIFKAIVKTI